MKKSSYIILGMLALTIVASFAIVPILFRNLTESEYKEKHPYYYEDIVEDIDEPADTYVVEEEVAVDSLTIAIEE